MGFAVKAVSTVGIGVLLCVGGVWPVGSQEGPEAPGVNEAKAVVHSGEWGTREFDGEILSGTVVLMGGGRRAVLVQARARVELWELGADSRIGDTGHSRWLADGRTVRVEWEGREREDFSASRKGSWPWKPSGDRFGAFRLSDWLIEKGEAVGLPFLGGESVGFSLHRGGIAKARIKSGGEVVGQWWWSGGLLHLRLDGFKEVATYEWRALASHVGWSEGETAPVLGVPVNRGLKEEEPQLKAVADRAEAQDGAGEVPGKVALCRRDVLAALLKTAAERSDVVSALGIEQQVLVACGERQKLVLQIVEAEQQLAEVLEQDRKDSAPPPAPAPVAVKTVAQLVEVVPPADPAAKAPVVVGLGREVSAGDGKVDGKASEVPGSRTPSPAQRKWSWFSLLGREGKLMAGITDGSGSWFVVEGERVPGGGMVRRISARPPAVEISGVGLLSWAERPPAAAAAAVGPERRSDDGRGGDVAARPGGGDEVLERVVESVLGSAAAGSGGEPALEGRADAIDGDSLRFGEVRVRLWGIDAPERKQSCVAEGLEWDCGLLATAALRSRATNIRCSERGRDRYGRVIAVCFERGEDVNAWMVSEGWALAYRQFSSDYVGQEEAAKKARKGIHRGRFVAPWEWRRGKRLSGAGGSGAGGGSQDASAGREELPPLPGRER